MTSGLNSAMYDLHHIDALASRDQWMNKKHPLVKLVITIFYIAMTVSFSRYDLAGLVGMAVYPIAGYMLADIRISDAFKRLRFVLPLVCIVGILNPFFDRQAVQLGGFILRAGWISMITLMIKGVFTVLAAYLLIATTKIDRICGALQMLHVPQIIVTQVMLMYRYIFLFLAEVGKISQAYSLRAPGQKGVHISAWGSLVGMMLLRSIDRANLVYESMLLRGFDGSFQKEDREKSIAFSDGMYLLFWVAVIILIRAVPIVLVVGRLFG